MRKENAPLLYAELIPTLAHPSLWPSIAYMCSWLLILCHSPELLPWLQTPICNANLLKISLWVGMSNEHGPDQILFFNPYKFCCLTVLLISIKSILPVAQTENLKSSWTSRSSNLSQQILLALPSTDIQPWLLGLSWLQHHLVDQRVTGLIPSQGRDGRQPTDASISHWCFPPCPSLPPFSLSLSLQAMKKKMSLGEDDLKNKHSAREWLHPPPGPLEYPANGLPAYLAPLGFALNRESLWAESPWLLFPLRVKAVLLTRTVLSRRLRALQEVLWTRWLAPVGTQQIMASINSIPKRT